jgi:hypothetical protein
MRATEVARNSEIQASFYETSQHNIPEESTVQRVKVALCLIRLRNPDF